MHLPLLFFSAEQVEDRRLRKRKEDRGSNEEFIVWDYWLSTDWQTKPEWKKRGMSQHQDTHPENPVENWIEPH